MSSYSGSIPDYYDRCLGRAWFDDIGAGLVARLPVDPGGDVLEIACGTGLATRRLRERLDPSRRLVASDLSEAMLDYARAKLAGTGGIEWRIADAASLPFADGEFAAAVCSLGVMFVPARQALFRGVRRVLKDGGLLLFTTWDREEEQTCARIFAQVLEEFFPGDGEIHFRTPYEMHDEAELRRLLADARLEPERIERVQVDVEGVSARDIAVGQVRGTPRGGLIAKRGVSLDEVIDRATRALEAAGGAGATFRGTCRVIAIEARAA